MYTNNCHHHECVNGLGNIYDMQYLKRITKPSIEIIEIIPKKIDAEFLIRSHVDVGENVGSMGSSVNRFCNSYRLVSNMYVHKAARLLRW